MNEGVINITKIDDRTGAKGPYKVVFTAEDTVFIAHKSCKGREYLKKDAVLWAEWKDNVVGENTYHNLEGVSPYHKDEQKLAIEATNKGLPEAIAHIEKGLKILNELKK